MSETDAGGLVPTGFSLRQDDVRRMPIGPKKGELVVRDTFRFDQEERGESILDRRIDQAVISSGLRDWSAGERDQEMRSVRVAGVGCWTRTVSIGQ
jgi:hypothetical protein